MYDDDPIWRGFEYVGLLIFYLLKWVLFFGWLLGILVPIYFLVLGELFDLDRLETDGFGVHLILCGFMCYVTPVLRPSIDAWHVLFSSSFLVFICVATFIVACHMQGSFFLVGIYIVLLFTCVASMFYTGMFSLVYMAERGFIKTDA